MSQIIFDEQLNWRLVLAPVRRWITAQKIEDMRPSEIIKDDRVLQILRGLKQPTFVTIDAGFYDKRNRDRRYCILYFALTTRQQGQIPILLRRLLRLPFFRTKAARMGKVAQVKQTMVTYWQLGDDKLHELEFYTKHG
jgi:hypothetical protein